MNQTIRRFGHPETLIADYAHWVVLLRPEQPTLGALVLVAKSDATAFADLPVAAFTELAEITRAIETTLATAVSYQRINYVMLMMVDPNVHFHVIPRYDGVREAAGVTIADKGWPKGAALAEAVTLDADQTRALVAWLKERWT